MIDQDEESGFHTVDAGVGGVAGDNNFRILVELDLLEPSIVGELDKTHDGEVGSDGGTSGKLRDGDRRLTKLIQAGRIVGQSVRDDGVDELEGLVNE